MKTRLLCTLLATILLLLGLAGCEDSATDATTTTTTQENPLPPNDSPTVIYYTMDDFSRITIGDQIEDVARIAPTDHMRKCIGGGFCDYPTEDGNLIRITFTSETDDLDDLVVERIETLSKTKAYYTMEDFNFIVFRETTLEDVATRIPRTFSHHLVSGGHGLVCEYPMENGGFIMIRFGYFEGKFAAFEIKEIPKSFIDVETVAQ